jgi:CheY-like chemotaxis protein
LENDDRELLAWVAEDDPEMRRMVAGLLRDSGFRVEEFSDGEELTERIDDLDRVSTPADEPSVVIVDHLMPGVLGLDAVALCKSRRANIPLIVITAFGDTQIHRRARRIGATAVLDKPFDLKVFRDLVIETVNAGGRPASAADRSRESE